MLAASFTLPPRSKRDAAKVPDVRNRSRYHHKTTAHSQGLSDNSPLHTGPLNLPPADRAYRFASCELLLLYPTPSRTLRSPGPLWTRLRAGRASPLFATRALTLPPSVPLIRRTLFTCGRVNPIAPSIAGRRREYQRSKRARLFRREYFKQSSSNFQIYLCKECPSRPAVSRSRNSKAHRRRTSAFFSALLFIRFSKVRYPHRTFRNDADFEPAY